VLEALRRSRGRDETIVVFTSDRGDLRGAHGDTHQKWYQAYEEVVRVPMIIADPRRFPTPRNVSSLTSHIDIVPTLLGLAGLDAEALGQQTEANYTDAAPLVGRDLSGLVLGRTDPGSVDTPLY